MIDLESLQPLPSRAILAQPEIAPDGPGCYFIFFDSSQLLLERSGYFEFDKAKPFSKDGHDLLYVGATLGKLRTRSLDHLRGNSLRSSLRMTVGALLTIRLGLEPVGDRSQPYFHFGDGEARLTEWLESFTQVAFFPCDDPFGTEQNVLASLPLPLNISQRKRHPFSRYLLTLRSYFAGRPSAAARLVDLISVGA